jgi:hypothetical protein
MNNRYVNCMLRHYAISLKLFFKWTRFAAASHINHKYIITNYEKPYVSVGSTIFSLKRSFHSREIYVDVTYMTY